MALSFAGCSTGGSGGTGGTQPSKDTSKNVTSVVPDVPSASGFPLPQGKTVTLTERQTQPVTVHVGDLVTVSNHGLDGDVDAHVLVLAASSSRTLTYQAAAPGSTNVITGPIGHPCRSSGKTSCGPDATPPTKAQVTVVR
ncbi:MAG: hypothetical protein J2O49_09025 [Sciscionella sp.]|nr:hypothetical protein [Sciscionella sp.]